MFPWNFFPFNKKFNNHMGQFDQNEIEKFVKDMMANMVPSQMQDMMNTQSWKSQEGNQESEKADKQNDMSLPYSLFETHNNIFVRIEIRDESLLSKIKLFQTSNQLIVENATIDGERITITLPSIVRKKGTTACFKDDVLEVKIYKNIDIQFSEIEIIEKL